ncbi:uncharacterized protein M6B38_101470 [Iris pallida]|uniref:Uncharacterized protein n=1 Tax=Iris pallida TaxID=29817 RepID=A0AAX6IM27_IRIPA|nr:uncharacterized protein M6B38_101470 [Iris pallida]
MAEEEENAGEEQRRGDDSSHLFQPNNSKSSKPTQAQLDKFKELNRRLLHIKEISKDKGKYKGNARKRATVCNEGHVTKDNKGICASQNLGDSTLHTTKEKDEAENTFASKKRRKLHWGLDTKERWERKANM